MSRVNFTFNLRGDITNWYDACNSVSYGIDWKIRIKPDIRRKIVGVKYEKAVKFLKPYLKELYKQRKNHIRELMDICSVYWDSNEKEIFTRLRKIMKHPVWPEKISCFYTSFPRCPYGFAKNHAWLYLEERHLEKQKVCATVMLHEIMHFQFHKYYWEYCREHGLNPSQTQHLKEATTFLINEEFSDLKLHEWGYPIHKRLRTELKKAWIKDKNFRRLVDRGIVLIKTKYLDLK